MKQDNNDQPISNIKLKQIALLFIIVILFLLIAYNLATFIPSLLGAITLYIVTRRYNFYLIEKLKWKPWISALLIILGTIVLIVIPLYFTGHMLYDKIANAQSYMDKFSDFLDKIQVYIQKETHIDILSVENIDKLKELAGHVSTIALSSTVNILTIVAAMYFLLYFLLSNPRRFEYMMIKAAPLKKGNVKMIGDKISKMVIANAIGIPVVSVGQALVSLIGYLIFGAPSPFLLFVLTALTAMIPVVGSAVIVVPVSLFLAAEGDVYSGVGLALFCLCIGGVTDNILRFTLLKRLENIHPLNTVFGIIMGINLFGFMGLIFGPILVSVAVLLIEVYRDEFTDDDEPEIIEPNDSTQSE
ncbi:AI-2E family transporter [Riemerella columbipharyngis]|uniref:Predicted PurR-regulated permease PerM n=1 Tax=Riemerella columbipharyngis TaxID=1071918 RepID=A0A1G7CG76_9FLAO|nr:AI-2E family transporter [Riemerella columbipharyngis]SDE37425.1 Predicted PurR-regulated permease PerM [Riemerella columbipharyngis]